MTSYSGVTWRVNYGEVSEREQFRVGRLSLESYDAYFPLSQLQDLIDTLNAVTPLGLNVIARGNQVQAVKVSDGLLTSVVISPRLDTGTPVESMRLPLSELTDLLYALGLFRSDASAFPDDWDFTKPNPIHEASLPKYLQQDELNATIAEGVTDRPALLTNTRGLYKLNEGRWGEAFGAVKAKKRDAKLLVIGDSTAAGIGGGSEATFPQQRSWPHYLNALFNELSIDAANGLALPKSSSGAQPSDSRWTLGAGWAQSNVAVGLGNKSTNYRASASATGALTFNDPRVDADSFDVYVAVSTSASYGSVTVQATGGDPVTAPLGSQPAKSIIRITVHADTVATTNVLTVTNSGGEVYVLGAEPFDSTTPKVRVGNAGVSGSNTRDWVKFQDDSTDNQWNVFAFLRAYEADLVVITLGINDSIAGSETTPAAYRANVQAIADEAHATGASVLLVSMIPSNETRSAHEALLVAELLDMGLPIIDIFGHYGEWSAELMDDAVHGNDAMYRDEARYIYDALVKTPLSVAPRAARALPARKPVTDETYTVRLDADQVDQEIGTYIREVFDERGHLFTVAGISGASAPKLKLDEIDGKPVIWFDGIANGLALTLPRAQPHTLVLQGRVRDIDVSVNRFLVASGQVSPNRGSVFAGTDGKLKMNAGATLTATDAPPTAMATMIFTFNGATSRLAGPVTTNTGTAGVETASVILLGRTSSAVGASQLNLRRLLVYPSAYDATLEAQIRADLNA